MSAPRFVGLILVAALVAVGSMGCAGYKVPSYTVLTVMANDNGETASRLPPICEGRETAAVDAAHSRDEALANTDAIHKQCQLALSALEANGKTIKAARDALKDAKPGADLSDALPWIKMAAKDYCAIAELLTKFKITLPLPPGVC